MNLDVLNQKLYVRLRRLFGTLRCFNQKQPVQYVVSDKKIKMLHWGECYAVNCPFCDDTKQHLWISHVWGEQLNGRYVYPGCCYRRNCLSLKENFNKLVKIINGELGISDVKPINFKLTFASELYVDQGIASVSNKSQDHSSYINQFPLITEINRKHPAIQFVYERKVDPAFLAKLFDCRVCDDPTKREFARLLFPVYHPIKTQQCIGYTARSYLNLKPKYLHSRGSKLSETFFNIQHAAKKEDFVIAVEGPFDVFRLFQEFEGRVVGCFGKSISRQQAEILNSQWNKVIVLFDGDAKESAQKAIQQLKRGYLYEIPDEECDPGSFTENDLHTFRRFVTSVM